MTGPPLELVARVYFARRVKILTRGRVAKILDIDEKAVDHIRRGRNEARARHLSAVSGESEAQDVYRALAKVAEELSELPEGFEVNTDGEITLPGARRTKLVERGQPLKAKGRKAAESA